MARDSTLQWLSLVGMIWLQSINGTNSNFPAYSSQLKELLSLSQLQLNNLALASDAGKLFGWLAGLAALYLPLWLVLLIGSILGFIGYGIQYLFLTHYITSLSYWHIFFLTVLAGNGICWINTVCYLVAIKNFPFHRQSAVGLSTSYLGLSAVVYTAAIDAFSSNSAQKPQDYMLFNALFPFIVSVLTAPFVRPVFGKPKKVEHGFLLVFLITIITGVYAVISSVGPVSRWFKVAGVGVCLASLLVIPIVEFLVQVLDEKCRINRVKRVCDFMGHTDDEQGGDSGVENRVKDQENDGFVKHEICVMEDIGVNLMLRRLNFWLYFFIYISGATLGLVYLNNLGQIAESRGYSRTSSLVSLASAFVFFGRLLPPILDYAYSSRKNSMVPGPASIVAAMIPMAGAFFMLINGTNLSLHISTSIISFSTGIITAISVSTTTELFGHHSFGVNHNVVVANIPLGSFLFGSFAALLYRNEGGGDGRCLGLRCYQTTFITWGSLSSFGVLLAFIFHYRTRKFYSQRF